MPGAKAGEDDDPVFSKYFCPPLAPPTNKSRSPSPSRSAKSGDDLPLLTLLNPNGLIEEFKVSKSGVVGPPAFST